MFDGGDALNCAAAAREAAISVSPVESETR